MKISAALNRPLYWINSLPRWFWHGLFWTINLLVINNQFGRVWNLVPNGNIAGKYLMISSHQLVAMASFYWLGYYVKPRFWEQRRYGMLIAHILGFWLVLSAQTHWLFTILENYFPPSNPYWSKRLVLFNQNGVLGYFFTPEVAWFIWAHAFNYVMTALLIKWIRDEHRQGRRMVEITTEKARMELSFLRSQINPHFLFNTFNNLYALIRRNDPDAISVLEELTGMMRYTLYDTNSDYVALGKEIDFIEDYIHLETIRLQGEPDICFEVPTNNKGIGVPPMIFITFVENAVKHGLNPLLGVGFLRLRIDLTDKRLCFSLTNSKKTNYVPSKVGGIGLANVRKRLGILFGDGFLLVSEDLGDQYSVRLEIPIVRLEAEQRENSPAIERKVVN